MRCIAWTKYACSIGSSEAVYVNDATVDTLLLEKLSQRHDVRLNASVGR